MMFKLALISALIVAAYCIPADKDKSDHLEQSETSWNSAWSNPAGNPNAGGAWQNHQWGGANNNWNRWGNHPAGADSRWNQQNRWGSANDQPWNRWGAGAGAGSGSGSGSQWNRQGAWPAAGGAAAAGRWNPW